MKFLLFLCGLAMTHPVTQYLFNETLKAMDQVYSWKIVNYYGEYQKGLAQVDDDAIQITFNTFDTNNDMKVSKEEILRLVLEFISGLKTFSSLGGCTSN